MAIKRKTKPLSAKELKLMAKQINASANRIDRLIPKNF